MKTKLLAALVLFALSLSLATAVAAEASAASTELNALVTKIQAKLRQGEKITEADLAPELKEFDALLAKHKDEKTDDVAQILFMKAMLYQQVLRGRRQRRRADGTAPARLPGFEAEPR